MSAPAPHAPPLFERSPVRAAAALVAMTALYFFSFFLRTAVPGTIFDELQSELQAPASSITALGSIFLYIYAGMQLFVGVAADRWGGARTLLTGGLLMGVGAAIFPASRSIEMLYVSRAITGFGGSFMYLSIVKELDHLFGPKRFAATLGVALFLGYSGGIAGMLPFERLSVAFGWRSVLTGVAVAIGVAWCVALGVLGFRAEGGRAIERISWRPLVGILANRRSLPLLIVSLVNYPAYFVMQTVIGKKFLQDYARLDSLDAAALTMAMMTTSAVLMLGAGPLLRWTGQRRKPHLFASVGCILIAALLMWGGVVWQASTAVFVVAYLLLAGSTAAAPAGNATMKELNRSDRVGQSIAVYNGLAYIGVAVLVHVAGAVLDASQADSTLVDGVRIYPPYAYAAFFAILTGLSIVSLVVTCWIPETRGLARGDE